MSAGDSRVSDNHSPGISAMDCNINEVSIDSSQRGSNEFTRLAKT